MGSAESALLDAVPVKRVVVLAVVSPGRRSGSAAACRLRAGRSLARADCVQAWRRARGRQGQALSGALARVLDRPCARRQFRCAGRDEETAAQPNKETGQPGLRGPNQGSWVDEGKAASRPGVPIPIPTRC